MNVTSSFLVILSRHPCEIKKLERLIFLIDLCAHFALKFNFFLGILTKSFDSENYIFPFVNQFSNNAI